MDGWMDGWVGGWMDGYIGAPSCVALELRVVVPGYPLLPAPSRLQSGRERHSCGQHHRASPFTSGQALGKSGTPSAKRTHGGITKSEI